MISVLYVDDEPALLELTKLILERSGEFRVTGAGSVDEALAVLDSHPVDVIASDYQMPDKDGIDFL